MVKIRKDVSILFDTDYATKTIPVDVKGGKTTVLELTFTSVPSSMGSFHGCFVEVDYSSLHIEWVTENVYRPRLTVPAQFQVPSNQQT